MSLATLDMLVCLTSLSTIASGWCVVASLGRDASWPMNWRWPTDPNRR